MVRSEWRRDLGGSTKARFRKDVVLRERSREKTREYTSPGFVRTTQIQTVGLVIRQILFFETADIFSERGI